MKFIVLSVRFLLELITIVALFSGVFISKNTTDRILFFILSVGLAFVWARYGAPKSPHVLSKHYKLILEIVVYSIGSFGFYKLFGKNIGNVYLFTAIIDLSLMYLLKLQGH